MKKLGILRQSKQGPSSRYSLDPAGGTGPPRVDQTIPTHPPTPAGPSAKPIRPQRKAQQRGRLASPLTSGATAPAASQRWRQTRSRSAIRAGRGPAGVPRIRSKSNPIRTNYGSSRAPIRPRTTTVTPSRPAVASRPRWAAALLELPLCFAHTVTCTYTTQKQHEQAWLVRTEYEPVRALWYAVFSRYCTTWVL